MSETKNRFIEINNSNLVHLEDIIALNIGVNNASLLLVHVNYTEKPLMVYYKNAEECKEAYDSLVKMLKNDNEANINEADNEIINEKGSSLICVKDNVFYYDNDTKMINKYLNLNNIDYSRNDIVILFCYGNIVSIYTLPYNLAVVNSSLLVDYTSNWTKTEMDSVFRHIVDIEFDFVSYKNYIVEQFLDIKIEQNKINTGSLTTIPANSVIFYFTEAKISFRKNVI